MNDSPSSTDLALASVCLVLQHLVLSSHLVLSWCSMCTGTESVLYLYQEKSSKAAIERITWLKKAAQPRCSTVAAYCCATHFFCTDEAYAATVVFCTDVPHFLLPAFSTDVAYAATGVVALVCDIAIGFVPQACSPPAHAWPHSCPTWPNGQRRIGTGEGGERGGRVGSERGD